MTSRIAAIICLLLPLAGVSLGDIVMLEDFEDAVINYTPSSADSLGDIINRNYYGRIEPGSGLPVSASYSNIQGTDFYAVEDIVDASVAVSTVDLDFSIDITGYTNLGFDIYVAEDDDGANQDWDNTDQFLVTYQIDGGTVNSLFSVQAEGGFNSEPKVDTDFDGFGDGTSITDTFQQFTESIAGTGKTLDLKLRFTSTSWAGEEDLAIDNVSVTGDFVGVPEPSSFLFLGLVMCCGGLAYRWKNIARFVKAKLS